MAFELLGKAKVRSPHQLDPVREHKGGAVLCGALYMYFPIEIPHSFSTCWDSGRPRLAGLKLKTFSSFQYCFEFEEL